MGKTHDGIDQDLLEWINRQKVFFVSTAPLSQGGKINCSPKGLDTFRVLGDHEVAYLDLTGSGAETIAHLKENGRIVLMFCAFDGNPWIVRLHGRGQVHEAGSSEFDSLIGNFERLPGSRAIILVRVERVSSSCGYGVPQYQWVEDRQALTEWATGKGPAGVEAYQQSNNVCSLDGLPAVSLKD